MEMLHKCPVFLMERNDMLLLLLLLLSQTTNYMWRMSKYKWESRTRIAFALVDAVLVTCQTTACPHSQNVPFGGLCRPRLSRSFPLILPPVDPSFVTNAGSISRSEFSQRSTSISFLQPNILLNAHSVFRQSQFVLYTSYTYTHQR